MSSTEFNIGLNSAKTSSRVLKPPGGGHSDIFGTPELKANPPRPKYNQQNSSNMNGVMGTTDPNIKIVEHAQAHDHPAEAEAPKMASQAKPTSTAISNESSLQDSGNRARVPPGGFSSGLW